MIGMAKPKYGPEQDHDTVAKDIMSDLVVVIRYDQSYREAVEILTENRLTGLPVVDGQGKLIGFISEKDILRECNSVERPDPNFLEKKIKYQRKVRSIRFDTPIDEIAKILARRPFRHIPVVDEKLYLKGIITRRDLIRIMYLRLEMGRNGHSHQVQA